MRFFNGIAAFQAFLRDEAPARIAAGKAAGLRAAAEIVQREMRGEIGTYQEGDAGFEDWKLLKPGTLDGWEGVHGRVPGKVERDMAPPDNPLLAGGEMRDSIGVKIGDDAASVGTDDPVAVWQNQGTEKRGMPYVKGETTTPSVPKREFVGRAGFRTEPQVVEAIGAAIVKALVA